VAQLRHCATSRKDVGSIPDGVTEFFIDIIPSVSNRNEYQEYLLGGRGEKSGSLNLLEPKGPVQGLHYLYPLPFTCFIQQLMFSMMNLNM
jgi:hypothetical protein